MNFWHSSLCSAVHQLQAPGQQMCMQANAWYSTCIDRGRQTLPCNNGGQITQSLFLCLSTYCKSALRILRNFACLRVIPFLSRSRTPALSGIYLMELELSCADRRLLRLQNRGPLQNRTGLVFVFLKSCSHERVVAVVMYNSEFSFLLRYGWGPVSCQMKYREFTPNVVIDIIVSTAFRYQGSIKELTEDQTCEHERYGLSLLETDRSAF